MGSSILLVASRSIKIWGMKLRLPVKQTVMILVYYFLAVAIFASLFYLVFDSSLAGLEISMTVLEIFLIMIFFLTALASLAITAAASQDSTIMAWWRVTPISDRSLGAGLSIISWIIALSQILLIFPLFFSFFRSMIDPGMLIFSYMATIVTGTISGRSLFVLSRCILAKIHYQLVTHSQSLGTLLWVFSFAFCIFLLQNIFLVGEAARYPFLMLLGYPIFLFIETYSSIAIFIGLFLWVSIMVVVEFWILPYTVAVRYDSARVLTLGFRFLARGACPIFKLEFTRNLRRKRIQAIILSAFIIQIALAVVYHRVDYFLRDAFFENTILVSAIIVAYIPLLARGMSDKVYPYVIFTGISPYRWSYGVVFSSLVIVFLVSIPTLAYWSVLAASWIMLFAGLGIIFFTFTVAMIVGFILKPTKDTSGSESVAIIITIVVVYIVAQILRILGQETMFSAGVFMGLLAIFLVHIPGFIEALAWKTVSRIPVYRNEEYNYG